MYKIITRPESGLKTTWNAIKKRINQGDFMKQALKVLFVVVAVMMSGASVQADDNAHQPPPDTSSAELNRIKAMEGRWASTTSMFGKPNQKVYTEFEVTSGGSAVLERFAPGTPHEMISMYYDDDKGKLAMTHYCIMRNRPTLKLAKATEDAIVFDVAKVEGLKSKNDPSMGGVTLNFKDKDHFSSTCRGRGKGAEDQPPMTMEFKRIK
jgi:hypothetical protein